MTVDQVCRMTTSPTLLNALHACRAGHPLNKTNRLPFAEALFIACQHPEISGTAIAWLEREAEKERDGLSPDGGTIMRVEIPAYTDFWMSGARYGRLLRTFWREDIGGDRRGHRYEMAVVLLDHPAAKRPIRVRLDDCRAIS